MKTFRELMNEGTDSYMLMHPTLDKQIIVKKAKDAKDAAKQANKKLKLKNVSSSYAMSKSEMQRAEWDRQEPDAIIV